MNIRNLVSVPTPVGRKNHFSKPSVHCTTNDYLNFKIALSREVAANEDISIDATMFTRLTPMLKPAFANATFEHRAFFVPYRTVLENFNELVTDTKDKEGIIPQEVGSIPPQTLMYWFSRHATDRLIQHKLLSPIQVDNAVNVVKNGGYDFACPVDPNNVTDGVWEYSGEGEMGFFNFTPFGKFVMDTLIALGYNLPYRIPVELIASNNFSVWTAGNTVHCHYRLGGLVPEQGALLYDCRPVSLMPLACVLKVYRDWYLSPKVQPTWNGLYIDKIITELATSHYNSEELSDSDDLYLLSAFQFLYRLYYDNDYFVSSQPEYMDQNGTHTPVILKDVSNNANDQGQVVTTAQHLTPTIGSQDGLTQYLLQSLSALSKWMRRNNIAGSRTLDRYLVHYGVQLTADKLKRSTYLGKFDTRIDVQAIMCQAQTDNALLGDYAGAGIGGSTGHFNLSTEEFGQLFIISICKPEVSYYQGLKKELFHLNRFDFFNDTFDNLGYQAVSNAEVSFSYPYSSPRVDDFNGAATALNPCHLVPANPDGVFGFQPRYFEYKCSAGMQDVLSGDFRIHSSGAESYDFFHQFRTIVNEQDLWTNNSNFQSCRDRSQYDRIFANTDRKFDHFICFYNFKVESNLPAFNPFDSLDFGDEYHNGNKQVQVNLGGTKF